ncbi:CAMK family protein kinase [Tritrichomonas foetus]|uniref:CAMK family protein kinase n=1 Tax=Tritrichomonas foetus TaxID=1144522 RepID=A0A1J4L2Q0_9EUKA|nr:CAMK family protein kinase [Tritrichomonas foetus]|eukprot:OHT16173.1 CAMK family protein kinase [Tritrichomonas foetus]
MQMIEGETSGGIKLNIPQHVKHYKIIGKLSNGATCCMFTGYDSIRKDFVAIKAMPLTYIKLFNLRKCIEKEIALMQEINHPNIVRFIDSFETDDIIFIVTEYYSKGDLLDFLNGDSFSSFNQMIKFVRGILEALKYLHKRGISHGDIKLENIAIDKHMNPKLIDFGFAKTTFIASDDSKNGSLICASPELFEDGDFNPIKVDMWAFGIMLFAIVTHQFPYQHGDKEFIINQIKKGNLILPDTIPSLIKDIIRKCTKIDPLKRPSASDLLKDELFKFSLFPKKNKLYHHQNKFSI